MGWICYLKNRRRGQCRPRYFISASTINTHTGSAGKVSSGFEESSGFVKCSPFLPHAFACGGNRRPTASILILCKLESHRWMALGKNSTNKHDTKKHRVQNFVFLTLSPVSKKSPDYSFAKCTLLRMKEALHSFHSYVSTDTL